MPSYERFGSSVDDLKDSNKNLDELEKRADVDETPNENILKKIINLSKNKLPITIIYCMVFWNFGICVALFGPTLLDLACQTASSLTAISWLYFIQNFTSLIGCLISGLLVKHGKYV